MQVNTFLNYLIDLIITAMLAPNKYVAMLCIQCE